MTGQVNLVQTKIAVLNTTNQISIQVERSGDLTTDASVAVLFRGSDFYYPSAGGYDGIKVNLSWAAGQGGIKTAVTPVIASPEKLGYLDIELVDFVRCNPGENNNGHVAVYRQGVNPSWIPSEPGYYFQQIKVSGSGVEVDTVPVPFADVMEMQGATATEPGQAGIVPAPAAGDNTKYLNGAGTFDSLPVMQGATATEPGQSGIVPAPSLGSNSRYLRGDGTWQDIVIPPAGIASIEGVSNPGGDIDLAGGTGIVVNGDNDTNTITISLPPGTAPNQTLIWNPATQVYAPGALPADVEVFTGATATNAGTEGIVPAPSAGAANRYPAADGNWRTENTIPGQTGGTNGKVVRITDTANTWTDAGNTDTVDQLYKASLAMKQGGEYFKAGSIVTGLSNLIPGRVYYLDVNGDLTVTMPNPSPTTRRVVMGTALAADTFHFNPGEVVTG